MNNEYYEILLSEYIKPPSNMIIEDIEGLTGSILKSFIRHNNIVKSYIEFDKAINNKENNINNIKEKLIIYIKSQIIINAGYDEKQRVESLVKYILQNNLSLNVKYILQNNLSLNVKYILQNNLSLNVKQ
jgi:hypothetical protein